MTTLQRIRAHYKRYFHMHPTELWAIDFLLCTLLSSKMTYGNESIFSVLIGAPSTGKTAIFHPIIQWAGMTETINSATENAFASGSPTVSNSFLHILDRRTAVNTDFSSMITGDLKKFLGYIATLRLAFDKDLCKRSGAMNEGIQILVRFSHLAACTDILYPIVDADSDVGQRTLCCRQQRVFSIDRGHQIHKDVWGVRKREGWQDTLRYAVRNELDNFARLNSGTPVSPAKREGEPETAYNIRGNCYTEEAATPWAGYNVPQVEPADIEIEGSMGNLLDTLLLIRSGVYNPEAITTEPEGMGRITNQCHVMVRCRAALDNRTSVNWEDFEFIRTIIRDTIPPVRWALIKALSTFSGGESDQGRTVPELSRRTNMVAPKVYVLLASWKALGLTEHPPTESTRYRLTDRGRRLIEQCRIMESITSPT